MRKFSSISLTKLAFILNMSVISAYGIAQGNRSIDATSSVHFQIRNFGFLIEGSLGEMKGKILFNQDEIEQSRFYATVCSATIDTGIALRDKHLRKTEYLDAESYPLIEFSSTRVYRGQNGILMIRGILSIKGASKEITFPFTVTTNSNAFVFDGSFRINRRDFGVGSASLGLSDEVAVSLNVVTVLSDDNP